MTKYFTSDTHFFHKNAVSQSGRPFKSMEDMNEGLVQRWNEVVKPQDEIYHLGDFSFGKVPETEEILKRLNGHKFLVLGNHDHIFRKGSAKAELLKYFEKVDNYLEVDHIDYYGNKVKINLCHYPMMSFNRQHRGSWMLHGHCHGNLRYPFESRIQDVGVDVWDYRPVSVGTLENIMKAITPVYLDHHNEDRGYE
jgi:calcineurin-like phosphoesterase family protein